MDIPKPRLLPSEVDTFLALAYALVRRFYYSCVQLCMVGTQFAAGLGLLILVNVAEHTASDAANLAGFPLEVTLQAKTKCSLHGSTAASAEGYSAYQVRMVCRSFCCPTSPTLLRMECIARWKDRKHPALPLQQNAENRCMNAITLGSRSSRIHVPALQAGDMSLKSSRKREPPLH